jgi:hypothetical protein
MPVTTTASATTAARIARFALRFDFLCLAAAGDRLSLLA